MSAEGQNSRVVLTFLWGRLKEHSKWLIFSVLFAAIASGIVVLTASLVQKFIDQALTIKDWNKVLQFSALLVTLFFFDGLTDYLHRFFLRVAVERGVRTLRSEIFKRFLIFSHEQNSRFTSGTAVSHIISDVQIVSAGMHVVADLIREPLVATALIGYIFYLNWKLTLVCLIAIPFITFIGKKLGKSARRNQGRIQQALEQISKHIIESVGGLRTAQAFGQSQLLKNEFHTHIDHAYNYLIRLARVEEAVGPLTKWTTSWIGALLIGFGGWLVVHEHMTMGDLVGFITAAGMIQQPLRQLNHVNVRLQQVVAAGSRIYDVLNEPLDPIARAQETHLLTSNPPALIIPKHSFKLRLENVSYKYPSKSISQNSRDWAVQNINLDLEVGKKIALVGKSGSGKSTLSLLALRFLDPSSGAVILGDKKSTDWNLQDYRAHFSHVSQDIYIFNRSIRDNLTFAKTQATDQEIWSALEKASLKDFVQSLPDKLDTILDEKASNLSGGERQRLAIARAFLRNSPIIILDEATSQLDAHNEKTVQAALNELMENRSALIIAHRLSTVKSVDELFVVEAGQIAESGKPEELMKNSSGHFARLWNAQHA